MKSNIEAIVKALVAVAWSDGRLDPSENEVLEALVAAFGLAEDDARALRAYARTPRSLDDLSIDALSPSDRRLLLHHAVLITYIDGTQNIQERRSLQELAAHLGLPAAETTRILASAERRARRLARVL